MQRDAGENNSPHPGEYGLVRQLVSALRNSQAALKKENCEDKSKHTILEGYKNHREFRLFCDYFLNHKQAQMIRNRAIFLTLHYGVWRSESTRDTELSDIFKYDFDVAYDSEATIPFLVIRMSYTKTTQSGKLQYAAMARSKDVNACCVGGLALYFYKRFNIDKEELPNVCDPSSFYLLKVKKAIFSLM